MNTKIALIVIYNFRFDENIEVIERIYHGRFSNIFHLCPGYSGDKKNVIDVSGEPGYFQGFISQGFPRYFRHEFTHYFFIADDLMLHPDINEKNLFDYFEMNVDSAFLPGFISLHETDGSWERVKEACDWGRRHPATHLPEGLPLVKEAQDKFMKHGLQLKPLRYGQVFGPIRAVREPSFYQYIGVITQKLKRKIHKLISGSIIELSYPLVGSYSDILIIPANCMEGFCRYCQIFTDSKLFVEFAIPTALVLSLASVSTEKDMERKGKACWTAEDYEELGRFKYKLKELLTNFPEKYLYIHPVKLSKWNNEL